MRNNKKIKKFYFESLTVKYIYTVITYKKMTLILFGLVACNN